MIELRNVSKKFKTKEKEFHAVHPTNLSIRKGEVYGIIGYSGAGKSTLLRLFNLIEKPTTGEVLFKGENLLTLKASELQKRRHSIGMIFQHFNLLLNKTVYGNIEFALKTAKTPKSLRKEKIEHVLEIVGLSDKIDHYPSQLSGGQKQRVAIARALVLNPEVLLCDEPTSALDPQTTNNILHFLKEINKELGVTLIIVTHEMEVVNTICSRVAVMENGIIQEELQLQNKQDYAHTNIGQLLLQNRYGELVEDSIELEINGGVVHV
ncbi:methionine ABC transporter ATP-binding protein [Rummeliibacillus pycnus]|uniref:methionine ABC transporter ATP-binding protein n=1 Tax=Rummeliibacillus pycnus TaxID=101070 RepID=UPI000C9B5CFB|nr:ATP-binding cassette domain-containing protein [Rummeliibacillus pycnus]